VFADAVSGALIRHLATTVDPVIRECWDGRLGRGGFDYQSQEPLGLVDGEEDAFRQSNN
jgi:hypothetical protein